MLNSKNKLLVIAVAAIMTQGPVYGLGPIKEQATSKSVNSNLPKPSQKMLDELMSKVKCVRVIDSGLSLDGSLYKEYSDRLGLSSGNVIFESSEPMLLKELAQYLQIAEGTPFSVESRHYLRGTPTFEFTLIDGKKVRVGLIGTCLRWNAWRQEACLLNPVPLIIWLGEHGALRPIREIEARFEYAKHIYKRDVIGFEQFIQAMPNSLKDFFGTIKRLDSSSCIEDMSENYGAIPEKDRIKQAKVALTSQFAKESKQIEMLLNWSGKIESAYHSYQRFPMELLLDYDPSSVLEVIKKSSLSPEQWVGVCRYYTRHDFRQKFPSGYKPLNKALRKKIIHKVKATGKNYLDVKNFNYAVQNWIP